MKIEGNVFFFWVVLPAGLSSYALLKKQWPFYHLWLKNYQLYWKQQQFIRVFDQSRNNQKLCSRWKPFLFKAINFKCSKIHRLCIALKLHAISLMGSNTRLLGVIWRGIHVTELLLSSLSPSFFTTCQIWESVSVSDFPHCCPAIYFRLLMAPTALQRSTGNTVLKHNKGLATLSSCVPDSQLKKSYCVWTVRMHKGL